MKHYDVIVVGAGPAGLGAAIEAGRLGAKVLLLDENDRPGGQLFKQIHKFFGSREHYAGTRGFAIGRQLLREAEEAGVEIHLGRRVWGIFPDGSVTAANDAESVRYQGSCLILATGASENALAFPGCTLPGVMTAGAAQTFANVHHVLPGQDIVMVGSGNVGLIVTYQLLQAGANVEAILEAAPRLSGYAVHAGKVRRDLFPVVNHEKGHPFQGHGEIVGDVRGPLLVVVAPDDVEGGVLPQPVHDAGLVDVAAVENGVGGFQMFHHLGPQQAVGVG